MNDAVGKFIWLLIGAGVTYCLQRIVAAHNDKRGIVSISKLSFRGFPAMHRQIFASGMTEDQWQQIPSRLRDHCITFVFFVESAGRGVIKDLRITVDANNGCGIASHIFLVDRTVVCDRLQTETFEDKRLVATWKFVNPKDSIQLHVLVAGIDDPQDVEFGVDGEAIEIRDGSHLRKQVIEVIAMAGQVPISEGPPTVSLSCRNDRIAGDS